MFDLPQEYNDAAKDSMKGATAGVPCPYPAPEMYWRNGDTSLSAIKEISDARRFGGWGIDKKATNQLVGVPEQFPSTWELFEGLTGKTSGETYDAYMTRSAWVAPIVRRYRWNDFSNRSEVQYLCYFAETVEKVMTPWGFVIVSAKSLDTKVLDGLFRDFENKTNDLRGTTRTNFFYNPIGTFGQTPTFETRGKGNKTSQVTPPQLFVPQGGYTVDLLKSCFVGQDIAAEIYVAINNPATKAWADDWNKKSAKVETQQAVEEANPFDLDPI
jgi:hypothetical protein